MSLFSILALGAIVLGGLCFWISGLLAGRRSGSAGEAQLVDALEKVRQRLKTVEADRDRAVAELAAAERELTRAAEELGRAEAELGQAEGEIERLSLSDISEEERAALASTPPPLPFPDPDAKQTNAIDDALAKLRPSLFGEKSEEEVEKLRAEADMPTDMPPPPTAEELAEMPTDIPPPPGMSGPSKRDRSGPGFQTVSIASRNTDVPSVEHDRLRAAHDRLKREKEDLESEFDAFRRELQQLKRGDA